MSASFEPTGVITITTDFGHQGPFVATMKGQMLRRFAQARIIDLTHEILVHWPAEAGFWLSRAYRYFPRGSVHVAVVDPGVGTGRDIIAVVADGHVFLAPDNGLLAPLVGRVESARIYRYSATLREKLGLEEPSATFHGRDIFAPLAAELAAGHLPPEDFGPPVDEIIPSWVDDPIVRNNRISGLVIAVDHFGNLISNIDAELVADLHEPVVHAGNHAVKFRRTYGDAKPGDYIALINSFGVVELARAEQSAADGLGLGRGAPLTVVDESRDGSAQPPSTGRNAG